MSQVYNSGARIPPPNPGTHPLSQPGTESLSEWVKHFQFRGKITVSDGFPQEKSGLNFSAAPSQLDSEGRPPLRMKYFSIRAGIWVDRFH